MKCSVVSGHFTFQRLQQSVSGKPCARAEDRVVKTNGDLKGNTVLFVLALWPADCATGHQVSDPLIYSFLIYTDVCTHCPPCRANCKCRKLHGSSSPEHTPEGSPCQTWSLKCPPPRASAACRRGAGPGRGPGGSCHLQVHQNGHVIPPVLKHPSIRHLPFSAHHGGKAQTPRHWPSLISSRVAGSSAFPTNVGVQSLYRRLILKVTQCFWNAHQHFMVRKAVQPTSLVTSNFSY